MKMNTAERAVHITGRNTMTTTTVSASVERHIAAPPELVYDLVSDVERMGDWSPETVAAEWIGGAVGPEVGARFKGTNKLGRNTWSTKPTVTEATRGRTFAFEVPGKSGPTWRYEFHPVDGGTRVVESVEQTHPSPWIIRFFQRRAGVTDRSAHVADAMAVTLERIDAAATAMAVA